MKFEFWAVFSLSKFSKTGHLPTQCQTVVNREGLDLGYCSLAYYIVRKLFFLAICIGLHSSGLVNS